MMPTMLLWLRWRDGLLPHVRSEIREPIGQEQTLSAYLELAHLTRDDVAALAPDSVLVLPTAATEQHGPHLPLGTDSLLGEAVARQSLSITESETRFVLAPVMQYGSSHHHLIYGALSLSTATFLSSVTDVLLSAVLSGFRRLYVLNSHGGNVECVRLASRDVSQAHDVVIGSCSYWDVSRPAIPSATLQGTAPVPGHAGQFETSLMLAVSPELVRLDRLPVGSRDAPIQAAEGRTGSVVHEHGAWQRSGGYTDVPTEPSAELGQLLLRVIAESVAAELTAFDALSRGAA